MSFNFQKVKQIEQYSKNIVFGYIREHEEKFKFQYKIPEIIIFMKVYILINVEKI